MYQTLHSRFCRVLRNGESILHSVIFSEQAQSEDGIDTRCRSCSIPWEEIDLEGKPPQAMPLHESQDVSTLSSLDDQGNSVLTEANGSTSKHPFHFTNQAKADNNFSQVQPLPTQVRRRPPPQSQNKELQAALSAPRRRPMRPLPEAQTPRAINFARASSLTAQTYKQVANRQLVASMSSSSSLPFNTDSRSLPSIEVHIYKGQYERQIDTTTSTIFWTERGAIPRSM